MPAPANAWAFADVLIVTRTAAAAAKIIVNFLISSSDLVDWCESGRMVHAPGDGRKYYAVPAILWRCADQSCSAFKGKLVDAVTSTSIGSPHCGDRLT